MEWRHLGPLLWLLSLRPDVSTEYKIGVVAGLPGRVDLFPNYLNSCGHAASLSGSLIRAIVSGTNSDANSAMCRVDSEPEWSIDLSHMT
jgi:hypothetical protein